MALQQSFSSLAEQHQQGHIRRMDYQELKLPQLVCDGNTFTDRLFMIRIDLRTLAAPILEYQLVVLLHESRLLLSHLQECATDHPNGL